MSILKDFRTFVTRGNVVDLAVGFIVGAAFGNIVSSLVKDVIMPPIGLALGAVDFKDLAVTLKSAQGDKAAVLLSYGAFINTIVSFLIVAFAVFILIRVMTKVTTRLEKPKPGAAATTKECPECMMAIPVNAKRCGHCTTTLK